MKCLAELVCGALGAPRCTDAFDLLKATATRSALEIEALEQELDAHGDPEVALLGDRLQGIRKRLELAADGGELLAMVMRSGVTTLAQTYAEYRARAAREVQHG